MGIPVPMAPMATVDPGCGMDGYIMAVGYTGGRTIRELPVLEIGGVDPVLRSRASIILGYKIQ